LDIGWFTYVQEQQAHSQLIHTGYYFNMTFRDIMENWQSEFLQLMWQVAGLSFLLYVSSPQPKESKRKDRTKGCLFNGEDVGAKLEQAE
jgi:hypothetical protein